MEIMHDGSVRMRGLLWNKQPEDGEEINILICFNVLFKISKYLHKKYMKSIMR